MHAWTNPCKTGEHECFPGSKWPTSLIILLLCLQLQSSVMWVYLQKKNVLFFYIIWVTARACMLLEMEFSFLSLSGLRLPSCSVLAGPSNTDRFPYVCLCGCSASHARQLRLCNDDDVQSDTQRRSCRKRTHKRGVTHSNTLIERVNYYPQLQVQVFAGLPFVMAILL